MALSFLSGGQRYFLMKASALKPSRHRLLYIIMTQTNNKWTIVGKRINQWKFKPVACVPPAEESQPRNQQDFPEDVSGNGAPKDEENAGKVIFKTPRS